MRNLLDELAGMIIMLYQGPVAAKRQVKRGLPDALPIESPTSAVSAGGLDPLARLPIRLTYRTARVLQAIAELTEAGAGPSNRQIAEHACISDPGQASRLLTRLRQHGLLENAAVGNHERGEANQWRLTQTGSQVVQSISPGPESARDGGPARANVEVDQRQLTQGRERERGK